MVELIITVVTLHTFRYVLKGRSVVWLIDAEAMLGALVKSNSDREHMGPAVVLFWKLVRELGIEVNMDRNSTDGNLSDKPSRAVWPEAASSGWSIVPASVPSELKWEPSRKVTWK